MRSIVGFWQRGRGGDANDAREDGGEVQEIVDHRLTGNEAGVGTRFARGTDEVVNDRNRSARERCEVEGLERWEEVEGGCGCKV